MARCLSSSHASGETAYPSGVQSATPCACAACEEQLAIVGAICRRVKVLLIVLVVSPVDPWDLAGSDAGYHIFGRSERSGVRRLRGCIFGSRFSPAPRRYFRAWRRPLGSRFCHVTAITFFEHYRNFDWKHSRRPVRWSYRVRVRPYPLQSTRAINSLLSVCVGSFTWFFFQLVQRSLCASGPQSVLAELADVPFCNNAASV